MAEGRSDGEPTTIGRRAYEAEVSSMTKLTDADIVPNYSHAADGYADDGDKANCRRCGARAKTGDRVHAWHRYPDQAVQLPRAIELCDTCDHQVRQLQSNLPK
jgi:hypothetical protein